MIEHRWSIACRHAVVDRYTNSVSLLDLIEQVTMRQAPELNAPLPLDFDIMSLWERGNLSEPERSLSRIVLVNPDESEDQVAENEVDLTRHQRLRARLNVIGIPFRGFGRYSFRLELWDGKNWLNVGRIYLDVVEGEADAK